MAEVKLDIESSLNQNLPSNSYKSKEPKPKKEDKNIPKTELKGNVTIKKRGFLSKFKGSMISEDSSSVGEYIVNDIVIPTVKDLLFNSVRGALEMVLYGRVSKSKGKHTPYSSISSGGGYVYNGTRSQKDKSSPRNSSMYFDVNNVMFDERRDAEEVLDIMITLLEDYGSCSITDFYDAMGQSAPYTAEKYGWKNLSDATVRSCREGYYIDFPQYRLID